MAKQPTPPTPPAETKAAAVSDAEVQELRDINAAVTALKGENEELKTKLANAAELAKNQRDIITRLSEEQASKSHGLNDAASAFRKRIAATQPPARFGDVPAAKSRIDLALAAVIGAAKQVEAAAATLADLQKEVVTGSTPPQSGAQAILGDDLPHYEQLIGDAREALRYLAGEV